MKLITKSLSAAAISAVLVMVATVSSAKSLIVTNNTDETSAIKIASGHYKGKCSSSFKVPGVLGYTKPHGTSSTPWGGIKMLCRDSGAECSAEIHMTEDCSDPAVAQASLTLSSGIIHDVTEISDKYRISVQPYAFSIDPVAKQRA